MERKLWRTFTVSRCSATYEPLYSYTVKYDDVTDEAYLWGEQEEKSILLPQKTLGDLLSLNLMSLPDAEPVDGAFLGLAVTDMNGQAHSKQISGAMEAEILAILEPHLEELKSAEEEPFMLDGPDMEYTPPWTSFALTRCDSSTLYSFWFTVTDEETDIFVTGQCSDKDGNVYIAEEGIPISQQTLLELKWLELEHLNEEQPWPEDPEKPLDMSTIKLTLTLSDGTKVEKSASGDLSMKIYKILFPYLKNNLS